MEKEPTIYLPPEIWELILESQKLRRENKQLKALQCHKRCDLCRNYYDLSGENFIFHDIKIARIRCGHADYLCQICGACKCYGCLQFLCSKCVSFCSHRNQLLCGSCITELCDKC